MLFLHRSWCCRKSDKWNSLSGEAKGVLQDVAIQHEQESVAAMQTKRNDDFAALDDAGMTVITLEGDAKANYLAAAREKTWERMKELKC